MLKKKNRVFIWDSPGLQSIGIALILLLAGLLLWNRNAASMQAQSALIAQVRFQGEYRIGDGPWQTIAEGEHIPSTKGDVTLRGNFHFLTPDGEYVGIYTGDTPIALYIDHILVTLLEGDREPCVMDMENPLYEDSLCGVGWMGYSLTAGSEEPIEIRIQNHHRFGNETAIDELLSNLAFWTGIEFEKGILEQGEPQRNIGLFFMIISLALLGIALFSTLIHIKKSRLLWLFGLVILCAGVYFTYSAEGVSFRSESVVFNTTVKGISMMLYMLFLSMVIVDFLTASQKTGSIAVLGLGIADGILFAVPMLTDVFFYDTWVLWVVVQTVANIILILCLVKECVGESRQKVIACLGAVLPLAAFGIDAVMAGLGIWKGGIISQYVFTGLFATAMVVVLRIMPRGINAAATAKELETEKTALKAQLAESRIATMMSQIRPHFIYNTLGSIEQLCEIDPPRAGELVHNFAKYLRGNFGELDNPRPILLSKEMEHVRYYVSIEKVRFPDMTFSFEMDSHDFLIPALTVQPLVENAIKHGLMKLPRGGTIRVVTWETDTHYCVSVEDDGVGFEPDQLPEERKHVGIRNIRERLKAMVNGSLEIESSPGAGTKVRIRIPKEVRK